MSVKMFACRESSRATKSTKISNEALSPRCIRLRALARWHLQPRPLARWTKRPGQGQKNTRLKENDSADCKAGVLCASGPRAFPAITFSCWCSEGNLGRTPIKHVWWLLLFGNPRVHSISHSLPIAPARFCCCFVSPCRTLRKRSLPQRRRFRLQASRCLDVCWKERDTQNAWQTNRASLCADDGIPHRAELRFPRSHWSAPIPCEIEPEGRMHSDRAP